MAIPAAITSLVQSWSDYYGSHQVLSVTVRFLHLTGLVVGGGTALAADRQILGALRSDAAQRVATLASLGSAHRVVVPALGLVVLTGSLLTAADAATFFASPLYWWKMALVALLLVNGGVLVAAEARAERHAGAKGWGWVALASGVSLVLWIVILFVGVRLTVAA
jgi:hypothetical protein